MKKNSLFKALLIVFMIYIFLSWVIPTGYFSSGSYIKDAIEPVGLFDMITYPLVTITSSVFILSALVFLCIGGFYGILNKTGAYSNFLNSIVQKQKGNEKVTLVVIALIFTIFSSLTSLNLPLFILVPFAASILLLAGYNKFTSLFATIGGILIGNMASTYGFNVAGYISYLTKNINDSILIRILFLILLTALFIVTLLKLAKLEKVKAEEIPLYEKNLDKDKKATPLIIVSIITILVIFTGMINWSELFNIKFFDNLLTSVSGFKIGGYTLFGNLLGTLPALGAWTNYEICLVLIINSFIIGKLYHLTFSEIISAFIDGAKKMLPVALATILASVIFLLMNTNSNGYTIYNTMTNSILGTSSNLNIFKMSFVTAIGSFLFNDFPYLLSALYAPITALYTDTSLIGMITQTIFGLIQFITPTSVLLVAGLIYFDVSYTEWLKKLWRFLISLLIAIVIILIIMIIL